MLTEAVLPLLLAATPVTLRIDVPQRVVFVGEPVRVDITWRAKVAGNRIRVGPGSWIGRTRFAITGSRESVVYREQFLDLEADGQPVELAPNATLSDRLVLGAGYAIDGDQLRWPFPQPGTYRVQMVYRLSAALPDVRSNVVELEVEAPGDAELPVLTYAEGDRGVFALPSDTGVRLLEQYRGSPYLRWLRVATAEYRFHGLYHNHIDPFTERQHSRVEPSEFRILARETAARLITDLLAGGVEWGVWEEDALLIASRMAFVYEDGRLAEIKGRLQRYPASYATFVRDFTGEESVEEPQE